MLSRVISIIFVALWVQFICDSAVSQSTVLSSNSNLGVEQGSQVVSTGAATNAQPSSQNPYANIPATSQSNTKPALLMGGYPNNIANNNINNNNKSDHNTAKSTLRNMLLASPTTTSPSPSSSSLSSGNAVTTRAVNNNVAVVSHSGPKLLPSTDAAAPVKTNPPTNTMTDSRVVTGGTKNEATSMLSDVDSSDNLTSSDLKTDVVKSDPRLKPTESMQDMLVQPQKFKSFLPAFLSRKKVDDPLGEDDGIEVVDKIRQGSTITERMYIESVTKSKSVSSIDIFVKATREERLGNYISAMDLYKEFIKLNSRRTSEGTLAVPYHRLALISWKQQRATNEADVYFRYALKYAKEGIVQIVVSDYNNFLTEYGKLNQAEAILRNTISFFPHDSQLKVELGRCLAWQDRPIEALRHIRPVLGEAQAYVVLANIYRDRDDIAMCDVLLQKRDEFIAKTHRQNMTLASKSSGNIVVANNIRNNNSSRSNSNNTNIESMRYDSLLAESVGVQHGVPLPAIGQNFSSDTSNYNGSDLPVDPFNIAANSNEITELGEGGWQELNNAANNAAITNQSQSPELKTSPAYRISGYHYSVEDVAPTFLQY
ncbi:MAG: tetratricopeptide repeat protein [Planctomycetaceae bacterium]|nr:tetratricopeptide repeat protein [Planctomycetaceae bacterium]